MIINITKILESESFLIENPSLDPNERYIFNYLNKQFKLFIYSNENEIWGLSETNPKLSKSHKKINVEKINFNINLYDKIEEIWVCSKEYNYSKPNYKKIFVLPAYNHSGKHNNIWVDPISLKFYTDPEHSFIEINENLFLYNWYGKYCPNITILVNHPNDLNFQFERTNNSKFNLEKGKLSFIEGDFRISKNKKPIFDMTKNTKKHLLIRDDWGGPFNKTRGYQLEKLEPKLHYRRASSNGGGTGSDFIVIEKGVKYTPKLEDLV